MRHFRGQGSYTYSKVVSELGDQEEVKIGNNTWVVRLDDTSVAIRHWRTNIITYYKNGDIIVDTNGWWTTTTKQRLNVFLPYNMSVHTGKRCNILSKADKDYEYTDGILIDGSGKVHAEIVPPPLIEYLETMLGIVAESVTEAIKIISTLDNTSLHKLWQRCRSLRNHIAMYCPKEFLPLTISSLHSQWATWPDIIMNRLEGKTYNLGGEDE